MIHILRNFFQTCVQTGDKKKKSMNGELGWFVSVGHDMLEHEKFQINSSGNFFPSELGFHQKNLQSIIKKYKGNLWPDRSQKPRPVRWLYT